MEIHTSSNPEREAGSALSALLRTHAGKPVLLLVSGGSAFQLLEHVDGEVLESTVTLSVLDERYSRDPQVHNFSQLSRTSFFTRAVERGVAFIDTQVSEGETRAAFAARVEATLHDWVRTHVGGIIIVTMGVGADGHTAGILSRVDTVDFDGDAWVVGYVVDPHIHQYTERVTVTNTFLRTMVTEALVFMQGASKRQAFENLTRDDGDLHTTPARVLRDMRSVHVYTDI